MADDMCPNCYGTGQAYAGRMASRPGVCRECLGSGEVWGPLDEDRQLETPPGDAA